MYAVPCWSTVTCGSFWPAVFVSAASARRLSVNRAVGGAAARADAGVAHAPMRTKTTPARRATPRDRIFVCLPLPAGRPRGADASNRRRARLRFRVTGRSRSWSASTTWRVDRQEPVEQRREPRLVAVAQSRRGPLVGERRQRRVLVGIDGGQHGDDERRPLERGHAVEAAPHRQLTDRELPHRAIA